MIHDPDYARYYTIIRVVAWQYGYAIGLHGSCTRDLDLIAVPWTEKCCDAETLIERFCYFTDLEKQDHNPTIKPHGRLAWSLLFPGHKDPRWIDISVMPKAQPQ